MPVLRRQNACFFVALLLIAAGCADPDAPDSVARLMESEHTQVLDLTHALHKSNPNWSGAEISPFQYDTLGAQPSGRPSFGAYSVPEHFGTHLDAPIHFGDNLPSVDEIAPSELFGPAVVVDASAESAADPDYALTVADLQQWEATHGPIPAGAVILMRTDWADRWSEPSRYRNADENGQTHFPGFSTEAAQWLIDSRDIRGIGIDGPSVDPAPAEGYPAHVVVNGAGKYHLENLASLRGLPAAGAYLIVAPIKIRGGSGGQVRVFAVLSGEPAG